MRAPTPRGRPRRALPGALCTVEVIPPSYGVARGANGQSSQRPLHKIRKIPYRDDRELMNRNGDPGCIYSVHTVLYCVQLYMYMYSNKMYRLENFTSARRTPGRSLRDFGHLESVYCTSGVMMFRVHIALREE